MIGVYADRKGLRAFKRVNGRLFTKRFPADTPDCTIAIWQALMVEDHTTAPLSPLATDVETYLTWKKALPTYDTRCQMMHDWVMALDPDNNRTRASLTTAEIQRVLNEWKATYDYAASTINHYRSALSDFFTRMDASGPNPVRPIKLEKAPPAQQRGQDYALIAAVLDAMPDKDVKARGHAQSKAKAMLAVMAYTGMPPQTIRRLRPEHLHLTRHAVLVPGRAKGAGTPDKVAALTVQGVAALKQFVAANAWGGVCQETLRLVFHRAVARVRAAHPEWALPPDLKPYDLRHSFGTAAMTALDGRLSVVAGLMGHADERTTKRYVGAAVRSIERDAATTLSAALAKTTAIGYTGRRRRGRKRP